MDASHALARIASRGTCDYATIERLAAAAGLRLGLEGDSPEAGMGAREQVLRKRALIGTLARARGVRSLELFGSAARGEARPGSDLDFIAELEPGRSLLDLIGLSQDLEELFGRKVEVVTISGLKPSLGAQAPRDAVRIV